MSRWSTCSVDSAAKLLCYKAGRPKEKVDHGVPKPAWWTEGKECGNMELCLSGSLAVGINLKHIVFLVMWKNKQTNMAASKKKPSEALFPQNCHFLYHVHRILLPFC